MKFIVYLSFLLLNAVSFGQEITVSGIITDKKTGEPIYFATVAADKNKITTSTDFDGKYSINVSINDTLLFSYVGMKSQKIKADKSEINIQFEELETNEEAVPPYHRKTKSIEATAIVTKKDIENAADPKYNFKKNAKNNVFVIYVSDLTSYDFNKKDLEFQQKYNVKYSLIGSYKIGYLTKHNKLTFKYLKKKYKKTWLAEIRKDAVGLIKG